VNSLLSDMSADSDRRAVKVEQVKRLGGLNSQQLRDWVRAQQNLIRSIIETGNATVGDCEWRDPKSPCWARIGRLWVEIGNMDPETAACAPSGLVALFGGSESSANSFATMFGGCGKGNFVGPIFALVLAMAGLLALAFFVLRFVRPRWKRFWYGCERSGRCGCKHRTESTTADDPDTLIQLDLELTKKIALKEELEAKLKAKLKKKEEETHPLLQLTQYHDAHSSSKQLSH
jgi:hypothetical protein